VCAVTPGEVKCAERVLALSAGTLDGIFQDIQRVAGALGLEEKGREVVARERARLENVRARTAGLRRPTVAMIEWTDPVFCMANWGPELVEAANGELLLGKPGQHSTAMDGRHVAEADPEVLIVAPCGFGLDRALQDRAVLEAYPWWSGLRAVRNGRVAFADGNLYFNRSGMTAVQTAEIIAEILHGVTFGESAQDKFRYIP
jgi:iron complex transport system substrate-binding protein